MLADTDKIAEKEREFHRCRAALSEAQISNQQLEMKMGELRGQLEMKEFELQLLQNSKKEQDALALKQKQHLQALSGMYTFFKPSRSYNNLMTILIYR